MEKHLIKTDLILFNRKNLANKISGMYSILPDVECNHCGRCCYDSPACSYVEFLNALAYLISLKLDKPALVQLFRDAFERKILSLIEAIKCSFIDANKKCLVYAAAPLSCKRWGLQSKSEYLHDLASDREGWKDFRDFYMGYGIIIPDSILQRETKFCKNVRIVNANAWHPAAFKEMAEQIERYTSIFGDRDKPYHGLCDYMAELCVHPEKLFYDRIEVIKTYQRGDKESVNRYIDSLDLSNKIDALEIF